MKNKIIKQKNALLLLAALALAALVIPFLSGAQWDFNPSTGSYSDSGYWDRPSSVWTPSASSYTRSPSSSSSSSGSSGSSRSSSVPSSMTTSPSNTSSSGTSDSGVTRCATTPTPLPNPQGTRSIEIRDYNGDVYYLSPPKEKVNGVRAFPETGVDIMQIIFGPTGSQVDEKKIGKITVDNKCYPKYGYIEDISGSPILTTTRTGYSQKAAYVSVQPSDTTQVTVDSAGIVTNVCFGTTVPDVRVDFSTNKILDSKSGATFGALMSENLGYINLKLYGERKDDRGCPIVEKPAAPEKKPEEELKPELPKEEPVLQPEPEPKPAPTPKPAWTDIPADGALRTAVQLMEETKAASPNTKKFGPAKKLKGGFAVQLLAALSAKGCGAPEFPGEEACRNYLVSQGFLEDEAFDPAKNAVRMEFYEYILKAINQPIDSEQASEENFKMVCTDAGKYLKKVRKSYKKDKTKASAAAQKASAVFLKAYEKGIIAVSADGNCNLSKSLTRAEAAEPVDRALNVFAGQ